MNEKNSAQASAALERYDALARRVTDLGHGVAPDPVILGRFRDRMDDDLNTGGALAIVAETVTQINRSLDIDDFAGAEPLVAAFRSMLSAVGLTVNDEVAAVADEAADLCRQRDDARAAKEWGRADALRGELEAMGYVVEDTATGTQVRRA